MIGLTTALVLFVPFCICGLIIGYTLLALSVSLDALSVTWLSACVAPTLLCGFGFWAPGHAHHAVLALAVFAFATLAAIIALNWPVPHLAINSQSWSALVAIVAPPVLSISPLKRAWSRDAV